MTNKNRTKIAGIINVTPDSFSDGGKHYGVQDAVKRGIEMVENGVEVLDIGGESTRPGSTPVVNQEEIDRIVPVIKELKQKVDAEISVDTWKAEVAQAAIEAGADIINDITGMLGQKDMVDVIAKSDVKVIAMFNPVIARPNHPASAKFPNFGGEWAFNQSELDQIKDMTIVDCMMFYFKRIIELATEKGIDRDRLIFDPGIGFALTKKENYRLVHAVEDIHKMGYEVFLGVSRKRFVVNTINDLGIEINPETEEGFANRDLASSIITAYATTQGVEYVRVHSIDEHRIAIAITSNIIHSDEILDQNFDSYKN